MIVAVPLLVVSLLSITPAEVERQSAARVVSEFERIGRKAPRPDARLERAARAISELALASSAQDAADPVSLTEAVSDAGGWDPNPRWLVVRASTPQLALESLLARRDLNEEPATHFGLSIATRGDESAITVMLSDRKAELAPFPRTFARAPAVQTLCGELLGLAAPEVYVTRPDGQVDQVKLTRAQPPSFCAGLDFPRPGRYTVEALGSGPRGPEVVALFFVEVATPGSPPRTPAASSLRPSRRAGSRCSRRSTRSAPPTSSRRSSSTRRSPTSPRPTATGWRASTSSPTSLPTASTCAPGSARPATRTGSSARTSASRTARSPPTSASSTAPATGRTCSSPATSSSASGSRSRSSRGGPRRSSPRCSPPPRSSRPTPSATPTARWRPGGARSSCRRSRATRCSSRSRATTPGGR